VSRPARILLLAAVALAFAAISFALARVLTAGGGRGPVVALVRAQARGARGEVLRRLDGCARPGCRAEAVRSVRALRRPGRFQVLAVSSSLHAGLGGGHGTVRIAWRVGARLPVVQCVPVRRTGSVLSGFRLRLERLPAPISREGAC
jgi:hypothetical protein